MDAGPNGISVAYDDPHDVIAPRKEFAINVVRGPMAGRPIVLHVRDATHQFAQPHMTPTEARALAVTLVRLADEIEQEVQLWTPGRVA